MKAFWLPSKTPEARALLDKPDMSTYCPASGKKLTLKQLLPVKFTRWVGGCWGWGWGGGMRGWVGASASWLGE